MRISWLWAGVGVALMLTFPACKSESSSGTGGVSEGSHLGASGGGDDGGDPEPDCDCACGDSPAGLVCNDPAHPSFCVGVAPAAGDECETALMMVCYFSADWAVAPYICD